ncbi:limonene-1,2-epoxide hydrolase family protein [Actinomadura fulvescens]|uniref:Limonene-1,2-epoxide hydrolase family protein n=1 Tax=Actinomadura fulvescens TaxID=46160 RepID=A0ABP6BWP4_9ACTN
MSEIKTVQDFLSALEDLDIDRALTYAAPEIVYQNVPLPAVRGLKAFERTLRLMGRYGTGFEARVHNIAANGPVVLTERTDVLQAGAWKAEFWVCGTFQVENEKIVLWRDYFDWATLLTASARGGLTALASAVATRMRAPR